MTHSSHRRRFLATGIIGAIGLTRTDREAAAQGGAAASNVAIVKSFCDTFAARDIDRVMAFFTDDCLYRMTETTPSANGREAVASRIRSYLDRVTGFDILDTYARGPMVVNERRDHFSGGPFKAWHGVGVFFLKGGKIAEWQDYTIELER